MSTVVVQRVSPASHRAETRGVLLAALVLMSAWAALIAWRRVAVPPVVLAAHQQSAFGTLTTLEQGLFNDLRTAVAEIRATHDDAGAWPATAELAKLALPPFAQDAVWKKRGGHFWLKYDAHQADHAIYWARPGDPVAAEWLLIWVAGKPSIWRRPLAVDGKVPRAMPETLPGEGWSEVVAQEAGAAR